MISSILPLMKSDKNKFFEELHKCEESGLPTYLYGAGEGASNIQKRAKQIGFEFAGKLVDKEYYQSDNGNECLEEILTKEKINLVVAHRNFKKSKLENWKENIGILIDRDCFSGNYEVDPEIFTFDFVRKYDNELTEVYNSLEDDKSREVLIAYINQKISMDYSFLKEHKSEIQYFDPELIEFGNDEALVDAGAYIGDTAQSFVEQLKSKGINSYDAIYSFEPDKKNYATLFELKINNMMTFNLATSKQKMNAGFSSIGKGSSSGISNDETDNIINIDTIDNVLCGKKVTFIKMDVEGYELESLKGAEQIIRTQRPKLAICIYHKKTDLWEIQNFIKSLVKEYKFYIRAYEETATELVLYALPF